MTRQKKIRSIEWDANEQERFRELIKDIGKRSESLARRIKEGIKEDLNRIKQNPNIFAKDPLKMNNDGTFRKFTVIYIRITYKVDPDKIIIARVRHSASEPKEF